MVPSARYTQARIVTERGRLFEFMAAPPARLRWARDPLHGAVGSPQPPAAPRPFRRNSLYLDASHFRIRIRPIQAQFPHTPAISIPAPDGTAESRGSSLHCR